jgi:saccharopine dehydrogenase (NAD+, L-lysine-forming)
MTHLWVRAEERPNEARVGLTPDGAAALIARPGFTVTVEDSPPGRSPSTATARRRPDRPGRQLAGRAADGIVFGLKELPEDGTPLVHRHIMFGHAYKGQPAGNALLRRFRAGGGTLYDLEYLTDETAAASPPSATGRATPGPPSLLAWAAQARARICPRSPLAGRRTLREPRSPRLSGIARPRPRVLIIGALGRVGTGAARSSARRWACPSPAGTWPRPPMAALSRRCWSMRSFSTASSPRPACRSSCPETAKRRPARSG